LLSSWPLSCFTYHQHFLREVLPHRLELHAGLLHVILFQLMEVLAFWSRQELLLVGKKLMIPLKRKQHSCFLFNLSAMLNKLSFLKNPILLFLGYALLLYIGWYLLYDLWLQRKGWLDNFVIENTTDISIFILKVLGFDVFSSGIRLMGIDGTGGLWVGNSCNGVSLFALFTGFILAYPGSIKRKLIFIPLGIITIHLCNILRVIGLAITQLYFPEATDFNHTYTFTIFVYGYIFLLWMFWVNRLSKEPEKITT
jgi:exosortase family protein XrtF